MIGQTNSSIAKPKISVTTMYASKWSDKKYSFEDVFPSTKWNIEIEPSSNNTETSMLAYQEAQIVASADLTNIAVATGVQPTVDIPIIIKAERK